MPPQPDKPVITGNGAGGPLTGRSPAGGQSGPGARAAGRLPLSERSPVLLAILGALCISATAILIKLANTGTATAAFYRCVLALPLLLGLALAERRRLGRRARSARLGAVAAGLCLSVDLVLWNHAIAEVGAGVATVLGNMSVVFVTAAAWLIFRERPRLAFLLALPVVMAGVVLVSGLADGAGHGGGHALAGVWYGVGTSLAYACFLLILRHFSGQSRHVCGPLSDATAGAAAGSLLLGLAFGGLQFAIPWPSFGWLLLMAITSGTIGWLLITSSLPRLPAALSSVLLLLQPAASLLLAAVVLAERPTLVQLAGAALVCCGVLLAGRSGGKRPAGGSASSRPAGQPEVTPPGGDAHSDTELPDVTGAGSAGPAGAPASCTSGPHRSSVAATSAPQAKMPADHQNAVL
jgi:drug/metabolite transporter (DMT)-like permease